MGRSGKIFGTIFGSRSEKGWEPLPYPYPYTLPSLGRTNKRDPDGLAAAGVGVGVAVGGGQVRLATYASSRRV